MIRPTERTWSAADRQAAIRREAAIRAECLRRGVPRTVERKPVSLAQHLREVDPGPHLDLWQVGRFTEACQPVLSWLQ